MNRHRVLVVEDDVEIREALLDLLEQNGTEAIGAPNGKRALEFLASADPLPCLILLDLMMPVMDGQAFREAQLKDPRIANIPIIVVSAYRDVQSEASTLKAAGFIVKPPRLNDVLSMVHSHC